MPITVAYPTCRQAGKVPDHFAGQSIRCPKCQAKFAVPSADQPATPNPPKAPGTIRAQPAKEQARCPYCSEPIRPTAKKCKHCGEWLDPSMRAEKAQAQAAEPFLLTAQHEVSELEGITEAPAYPAPAAEQVYQPVKRPEVKGSCLGPFVAGALLYLGTFTVLYFALLYDTSVPMHPEIEGIGGYTPRESIRPAGCKTAPSESSSVSAWLQPGSPWPSSRESGAETTAAAAFPYEEVMAHPCRAGRRAKGSILPA